MSPPRRDRLAHLGRLGLALLLAAPACKAPGEADPCCPRGSGGGSGGGGGGEGGEAGGDDDADCPEGSGEDALLHLGRASTPGFLETTDVLLLGEGPELYACTGVQGLQVHSLADPVSPLALAELTFEGNNGTYPRCQYVAWDGGDRVLVSAHTDAMQPTAWVGLVDRSEPLSPVVVDSWLGEGLNLEEVDWLGDRAVVAAHEDGLVILEVSEAGLSYGETVGGLGNTHRVRPVAGPDGAELLAVGTVDGTLHLLDADLALLGSLEVGSGIQDILPLAEGDGLALALGAGGLARVDLSEPAAPELLGTVDTRGAAMKLGLLSSGDVAVANWTDLRVYAPSGGGDGDEIEVFELVAVDDVYDAGTDPRIMAAGAAADLVVAGEWTGLHTFLYDGAARGPELTSDRRVKVPGDGGEQTASLLIRNEGQDELRIEEVHYPEGWSGDEAPLAVAAGAEAWWRLVRAGTGEALDAALEQRLALCTNDLDEPTAVVTLQAGSEDLTVGDEAADFQAVDIVTGEVIRLSDHRGEVVLLAYFATF